MREIQASDAKARLAQLLDEVERGETVVITRHGRAVARLVPEGDAQAADKRKLIQEIREFRRSLRNPISVEELLASRHEGHKY
jgi:prevent-host-death family protein